VRMLLVASSAVQEEPKIEREGRTVDNPPISRPIRTMSHPIAIVGLDDCFASNVIGLVDLLHCANLIAARRNPPLDCVFEWQVLSIDGEPVRASNGYRIAVDGALDGARPAKVVIVPAVSIAHPEQLERELDRYGRLLAWIQSQFDSGATIAAVCSGSFLLAETGLLDRQPATTTWWLAPLFEHRFPRVALDSSSMLTDAGRIICCGTGMSHIDLGLYLIERYGSRELARLCAKYVVLDSRRRSQAPYTILNHLRTDDPVILKAEKWIKANLRRNISVDDIAKHAAVSQRTLLRRFKESTGGSPLAFVHKIRIEASKALLENTKLRIDEIVDRVGYTDAGALRRVFKKHTNMSPREYRIRFGVSAEH
jgi:transcriptional regulator GlxA family with amidase domain